MVNFAIRGLTLLQLNEECNPRVSMSSQRSLHRRAGRREPHVPLQWDAQDVSFGARSVEYARAARMRCVRGRNIGGMQYVGQCSSEVCRTVW